MSSAGSAVETFLSGNCNRMPERMAHCRRRSHMSSPVFRCESQKNTTAKSNVSQVSKLARERSTLSGIRIMPIITECRGAA